MSATAAGVPAAALVVQLAGDSSNVASAALRALRKSMMCALRDEHLPVRKEWSGVGFL